jgi:hypothetical protein
MTLSDRQIERYSRQIIVPHVGGRAQERLLAARIVIAGEAPEIDAPLAYLTGAGAGTIELEITGDRARADTLAADMRALNGDVTMRARRHASAAPCDLALAFISSAASLASALDLIGRRAARALVICRLDQPALIGIFPTPRPCPRCAGAPMLSRGGDRRADAAGVVAMIATAEAFKLLCGYDDSPAATLVEFDGYRTTCRAIAPDPDCACAAGDWGDAH